MCKGESHSPDFLGVQQAKKPRVVLAGGWSQLSGASLRRMERGQAYGLEHHWPWSSLCGWKTHRWEGLGMVLLRACSIQNYFPAPGFPWAWALFAGFRRFGGKILDLDPGMARAVGQ